MRRAAREHEADDKQKRDGVEKLNTADSYIFSTEKNLTEYGEKIPVEKRTAIESALERLKEVHKNENLGELDSAIEQLNQAWEAASKELYEAEQEAAKMEHAKAEAAREAAEEKKAAGEPEADVTDADFEVVEEDEK